MVRHRRRAIEGRAGHPPHTAGEAGAAPASTATAARLFMPAWASGVGPGWAALIFAVVLAVYAPVYHGDWLWDDDLFVLRNETVQSGTLAGLAKLWLRPDELDYFPLAYTAMWLQWPFFGKNPTGYHLTSILLHASSAVLLGVLLRRMQIPGAGLAGLLFAVHPACVESVAWIAEIKNTLSLPLFLLAAICWVRQDDEPDPVRRRRWLGAAVVAFLLSMLAKTALVAFPVVTLLHAWWKRDRITRQDLMRAAPLFAVSLCLGLLTLVFQHGRAIGWERIPIGSAASRVATAGMAILFYVATILWPVNLLPNYPRWEVDPPRAWQFVAWVPIGAGLAWAWANRAGPGRHVLFAAGFFLLMVFPVLGFVSISYMRITWVADHFIYAPLIGIVALVAAAGRAWFDRSPAARRPWLAAAAAVVVVALATLSFRYAGVWVGEEPLWTYTLARNPDAWQAHARLGSRHFARREFEAALRRFEAAARLRPELGETLTNKGLALAALGRRAEAIDAFYAACGVAHEAGTMGVHQLLANELFKAGRYDESAEVYRRLAHAEPDNASFSSNLGVCLLKTGRPLEAADEFRRALALEPGFRQAEEGLALATEAAAGGATGNRADRPAESP